MFSRQITSSFKASTVRSFSTTLSTRKTLTDSVVDGVKSAAEAVNRVAGNAALKGIDGAEVVKEKAAQVAENARPLTEKAKDIVGDASTKAKNLSSDASNEASKLGSEAQNQASKLGSNMANEEEKLTNEAINQVNKANR